MWQREVRGKKEETRKKSVYSIWKREREGGREENDIKKKISFERMKKIKRKLSKHTILGKGKKKYQRKGKKGGKCKGKKEGKQIKKKT